MIRNDELIQAEALERFWDDLQRGRQAAPDDVASDVTRLVEEIQDLGPLPDFDGAKTRVWRRLIRHPLLAADRLLGTSTQPPLLRPRPIADEADDDGAPVDIRSPRPKRLRTVRRWSQTHLATAALLVLTLGSLFIAFGQVQLRSQLAPVTDTVTWRGGDDWQFQGGPARTGVLPGTGPLEAPVVRWTVPTVDPAWMTPALAHGLLYVGTIDGALFALDAETGAERWRVTSSVRGWAPRPAVDGDSVYAAFPDKHVYALDAMTGETRWSFATDIETGAEPAVVDGVVYFSFSPDVLETRQTEEDPRAVVFALDTATGQPQWTFTGVGPFISAPTIADGLVYIVSGNTEAGSDLTIAIDAATGIERWRAPLDNSNGNSIAVADGAVYVVGRTGVDKFDAATGDQRWHLTFEGISGAVPEPAIAHGLVYVSDALRHLVAIDVETGVERWRLDIGRNSPAMSAPVVVGDVVYVGTHTRNLFAVNALTGETIWKLKLDHGVRSSPVVADTSIYVTTSESPGAGKIYALGVTEATPESG
jgi:outer membrane protein assembly factor BamB